MPSVAVLGSGLQGTSIALELARRGCEIDLLDLNDRPITRAGFQNEGKLHLGFVYGNDQSLRTARRLAEGALRFLPLVRRWVGSAADAIDISRPFIYAVPSDSMLSPDAVADHFARVEAIVRDIQPRGSKSAHCHYPGLTDEPLFGRMGEPHWRRLFSSHRVIAAFHTREIAVNPPSVAAVLRHAVAAESHVRFIPGTRIESVTPRGNGYAVQMVDDVGERQTRHYDVVVNALWDDRLRIDRQLGLLPDRPWLWRYKVGIRVLPDAASRVESVTFMLGPYGDVVRYNSGVVYASWYPDGLLGITGDLAPPHPWTSGMAADPALPVMTLAGLTRLYPDVASLVSSAAQTEIVGGVIFAWGTTDIDDPESELHLRYDIGVDTMGHYHTINTGKYTMAPILAIEVADRIAPILSGNSG